MIRWIPPGIFHFQLTFDSFGLAALTPMCKQFVFVFSRYREEHSSISIRLLLRSFLFFFLSCSPVDTNRIVLCMAKFKGCCRSATEFMWLKKLTEQNVLHAHFLLTFVGCRMSETAQECWLQKWMNTNQRRQMEMETKNKESDDKKEHCRMKNTCPSLCTWFVSISTVLFLLFACCPVAIPIHAHIQTKAHTHKH